MNDPKQLLEQWIDAERAAEPSPATRAANWDGLQSRLAAAAAPTATAAGGFGKLLAAVLAVGGAGLVALALTRGPAPDAATTDAHVLEDRDTPPAEEPVSEDMHASAASVPQDIQAPHLAPVQARTPHVPEDMLIPPTPSPEPHTPHVPEDMPESTLGWDAELALLQRTQSALRDGRAAEAVAHADEYRQRWPRGVFIEEIEAARVLGLCAQDDPAAARKAAAGFHRARPHSLYAAKIDQSCPGSRARARRTDEAADTTH
ncbi:hypothetical protein OV203_11685 [Nannocystis sp. ILAH1]|uniref:hypothetical protein n=1 Tax=unclassified Nannocystis TaxID=2627009 RepID=UPI00226D88C7|nr:MULTISPECIES: hypothetical protein [unclassified Nannocystis]MCY0987791.1 hypothetical protein [Nannocystis sp. ILAH1]MCY1070408.1 hypothetical protein [Nannocystis sp. RBIL2]